MIDPNDIDAIKQSNAQAIPKARNRERERTPDQKKNRKGKYPMVYSQEFPGGHKMTFDSTPGHRAIEIVHGSGTTWQIAEDGKSTKVVVGNSHEHYKEGVTLTIDQNGDIKINGHTRLSITGGAHIEIAGDTNLVTTGDMNHFVGGNLNTVVNGDHNMHVTGNLNQTAGADHNMKVKGNLNQTAGADNNLKVKGKLNQTADGDMTVQAPTINLNKG